MRRTISLSFILFVLVVLLILPGCGEKEEEKGIELDQEVDVDEYKKSLKPLMDMKILVVVSHDGFDEIEYATTKNFLVSQGAKVETASTVAGQIKSDRGAVAKSEMSLSEVDLSKYEALIFVGGIGAEDDYFTNSTAHSLIRKANDMGLVIGASSISPAILANAGVLSGKKATVYDDEEGADRKIFNQNGVEYVDENVVVTGNIITCNHRDNIKEFAETVAKELKDK